MFGIELTLAQKVSIAVVLVALGVSVVFIMKAMRPEADLHINAYVTTQARPLVDDEKHSGRITTTNPRDPKKDEKILHIAVVDGMLDVIRYPNDPGKHVRFKWMPERRLPNLVYQYYRDPMKGVEEYSDGFRHALAYATYKMTYEVPGGLGLLGAAAMTEEQAKSEATARALMKNEIALLRVAQDEGKFHPELLGEVEKALAAYEARGSSPEKDSVAAGLARKILDAVVKYLAAAQGAEDKSIDTYITTMDKVLTEEQKGKFVTGYQAYLARTGTKVKSTPPLAQPGRSVPPVNRGAATTMYRAAPPAARGPTLPERGPATAGRGGG